MGFTNKEQNATIILMLSSVTSLMALSTVSSYPKDFKRHASPHIDWEPGLKEAARQVLLRNRDLSKSIRDKLLTAPIFGKENRALPFGDIAVLARGQLFAVPEGFRWVQDPYQNDCVDCHATRFCKHSECGVYKPHGSEKLLALWSVKRIRHRSGDLGHRYELEYTISPINPHNKNTFIDKYGGFNYNIPGHVFIVKTQNEHPEFIKTHNKEHFISNSWNNHKYIPAGLPPPPVNDYYLPIPSTVGNVIHPLKPSNNEYLPAQHGSRPDYHYLPQKPTQSYHHHTTTGIKNKKPTYGSKNDLYKKLLESLAQKTSSTKFMLVPTKAIPHRFGPPTRTKKPTTHTSSSSSTTNQIPITFTLPSTTHAHVPTIFTIPSTSPHVPTTAQQIPTPQIPTTFIPMRPQTMTTIFVPTMLTTSKLTTHLIPFTTKITTPYITSPTTTNKLTSPYVTTSKITTPYITTSKITTPFITTSKLTSPYTTSSKLTSPYSTSSKMTSIKPTTLDNLPYIPTSSYLTTKETIPYVTIKDTTPYITTQTYLTTKPMEETIPYMTPSYSTSKITTTKQTTPYYTSKETTPYFISKITTPYYTSKQTIPYLTTKETIIYTTNKQSTPYLSTKETTPYLSTKGTTPYLSTKETTPYLSTKETTPYLSTKVTTPYLSTKETTPYLSTKETTPYLTTSPQLTTKDTSLITTLSTKETSPYYITEETLPPKTTSQIYSTVKDTTEPTQEYTKYPSTETSKPVPTFFIDLTHPGYPRTTPITPFTESYNRGSEQSQSETDQNITGPATTSHTVIRTTTKTSGMTTLQLPASTDRYFPESTPHVIKIPPKPPKPNTPFKKPTNQDLPEDYSEEYELFPEDKNKTTTSTPKTTSTTGIPKPTEGFLLHEDEYYPNRIKEEEVDKAIALFDKEFTQKPFVTEESVKMPVVNNEFDDVFENGTTAKPSKEEDTDLFPESPIEVKATTQRAVIMVNNENSDLFSDQPNKEIVDNLNNSEDNVDLFSVTTVTENAGSTVKGSPKKTTMVMVKTTTEKNEESNPIGEYDNSENNPIEDNEKEDVNLFDEKITTENLQIIPTASYENVKDDAKIIYSGFFEPSTTPMMTTETPTTEQTTTQIPKIKRKKHVPTLPTNRVDEISTKQSLATSVSYKVNKYKRRRAPTRVPQVRKATTVKNKFEVKYSPKHLESRSNDETDLIQIESNNTRRNSSKLAEYRRKLYARNRKAKTRVEN